MADCSDRFNEAAIDLSNRVNPQIRKILLDFVKVVKETKPCIFEGDFDCIERNIQNVGLVGLRNAQRLAVNPSLRQLFGRLYAKDSDTLKQIEHLQNGSIGDIFQGAVEICDMFNYKTNEIRQFLLQRK